MDKITMAEEYPVLFEELNDLFRKVDQSKYAVERAEHILAILHFCADEGRVLLEADERLRAMIQRRCREYRETATYYQEIAEEAARILTLLSQEPNATVSNEPITYDPKAHHC